MVLSILEVRLENYQYNPTQIQKVGIVLNLLLLVGKMIVGTIGEIDIGVQSGLPVILKLPKMMKIFLR